MKSFFLPKSLPALCMMILTLLLLNHSGADAQEVKCGTDEAMRALEDWHKANRHQWKPFDAEIRNNLDPIIIGASGPCEEHYVIPVVFHVFVTNGSSVVPMSQIQSGLDKANEDINLLNADAATIDPAFTGIKAGFNISLELAQLDPSGNPTTGINYYPTTAGFGGTSMNATVASYAWDNYKYLNIYLMRDLYNDGVLNNSGVAWLPDTWMSNNGLARIVYNYVYLGSTGSSIADPEFQSVFTHEVGHYLGLDHTFKNGCNLPGDYVDDTPPTQGSAGCGPNAWSCGNLTNGENYMDYNATCYKMFTQGQVERMKDALEHSTRKPLWQKANLQATGLWSQYNYASSVPAATFEVTDTVIYEGDNITFTDLSCHFATSRTWTFNGGNPGTSTTATQAVQYNTAGSYTASLVVSNGNGSSSPATVNITVLPAQTCVSSEGYENTSVGNLPFLWLQSVSGGIDFEVQAAQVVNTGTGTATTYSHSGNKAIYSPENWDGNGPVNLRLISAPINLSGITDPRINWWDMRGWDHLWPAAKPEHMIEFQVGTSQSGPWTTIGEDTTHQSEFLTWRQSNSYDLSAYAGQTIYLSWYTTTHHYYWRIDDLCVSDAALTSLDPGMDEAPDYHFEGQWLRVDADDFGLYDLQGRKILVGSRDNAADVSVLSEGVYVLRMRKAEFVLSKKVLIRR